MKKKLLYTIFLFLIALPVFSSGDGLEVYLSLDKEKFHSNEDVLLKIHVKNTSAKRLDFIIYDVSSKSSQSFTTFQPVVFNIRGKVAENIVPHVIDGMKNLSKKIIKRKISLGPMEEIVRKVYLNKIYDLKSNVDYQVKGYFFPDYNEKKAISSSNKVKFFIVKPALQYYSHQKKKIRTLSPDEIVLLTLHAEKTKNYERMIKYLDLSEYINSFSQYVRKYNLANRYEKKIIENKFIRYLSRDRFDYIVDFKIKRVKITGKRAIVIAEIERFGLRKSSWFSYRFNLEKNSKTQWLIQGYEATVIRGK